MCIYIYIQRYMCQYIYTQNAEMCIYPVLWISSMKLLLPPRQGLPDLGRSLDRRILGSLAPARRCCRAIACTLDSTEMPIHDTGSYAHAHIYICKYTYICFDIKIDTHTTLHIHACIHA